MEIPACPESRNDARYHVDIVFASPIYWTFVGLIRICLRVSPYLTVVYSRPSGAEVHSTQRGVQDEIRTIPTTVLTCAVGSRDVACRHRGVGTGNRHGPSDRAGNERA